MIRRFKQFQPIEKIAKFVLRIPDGYSLALDGLVKKGVAKSKNELIVEIIAVFLSDLRAKAEMESRSSVNMN